MGSRIISARNWNSMIFRNSMSRLFTAISNSLIKTTSLLNFSPSIYLEHWRESRTNVQFNLLRTYLGQVKNQFDDLAHEQGGRSIESIRDDCDGTDHVDESPPTGRYLAWHQSKSKGKIVLLASRRQSSRHSSILRIRWFYWPSSVWFSSRWRCVSSVSFFSCWKRNAPIPIQRNLQHRIIRNTILTDTFLPRRCKWV